MSAHTCPFSRCRLPFASYDELVAHVDSRSKAEDDSAHNVATMTAEDLAAEVRHVVAMNLRLEQSAGYHKAVADSWHEAYALGKIRGR